MSVLKLSKDDIIKNEDKEDKIKLKRSDLSFDSTKVSEWETTNKQALDILNDYNNRINKSEWLTEEDRTTYRKAIDTYVETANYLRGLNKTFGEGYSEDDEKKWSESIANMNKGYDEISRFYSQFASDTEYNRWAKVNEYKSVPAAEDFAEYSQLGASVENPTWREAKTPLDLWGWKPFGEGKTINNMVTFATDNEREAVIEAAQALRAGGGIGEHTELVNLINLHMTDEEKATYNYYIGKGDTEKASEYMEYMMDQFRRRTAGKVIEQADNNVLELVFSTAAGLENAFTGYKNLANMITGKEGESTSALQYAHGEMSSNNTGIWKVSNDLANTTGNMLPSILVGSFTGGIGGALAGKAGAIAGQAAGALTLGASASGNAYAEMRHLGYNRGQASAYAGLVGASEAALQYALGGISKLGGKISGNAVGKLVSKFDNAIARTAIKLGGNMASEGLEEAIQTVLEPAFKALATGEQFESPEWEEVWYSALLGALSAGMLEGVPTIAGTVAQNMKASKIYGTDGGVDLVYEALAIDPDNAHAQRMKGRLDAGKDLSGYQLNRLVEANESTLVEQDKGKIKAGVETRLTELGETGNIGKISDVLVKQAAGGTLTSREVSLLNDSQAGHLVAGELNTGNIMSGGLANNWAGSLGTERINPAAYNRNDPSSGASIAPETGRPVSVEEPPEEKTTIDNGMKSPANTMATIERDGEEVKVKIDKINSIENGEISVKLESGETLKVDEVEIGGEMALVYQAASDMATRVGGFNVDTANVFVKGFNPNAGLTAAEYVHGFSDAYRFGKLGYPVTELEKGAYTSKLTDEQRTRAYNFGKVFGNDKVAEKQTKVSIKGDVAKKGKIYFDGNVSEKNITARQRASIEGLRIVSEALGIDIHVFESPLVNGKREGANGWYDLSDNSIHIDLYAGVKGDGLMLFTASHELTHHIREVSPAKFKVFADALLEEYTKNGQSIEELIERKLEMLEANGRLEGKTKEQAYDLAYEEVVADSCEAMLIDSNAIEALSRKIKAKDKGLWQTIKDFIASLVARIKAAYKGLSPDSAEANHVRDMVDAAERLQKLWVDALLDASDRNASIDNTLMENGIVVDSKTESASLMSVRDVLTDAERKKVSKALAERFGVTQAEAMDWLKAETSLASLILNPKYSQYLDYTADASEEAIKSNSDYPQGTVDFSNICKKRRDFTEVMNRVLRNFPNHVFAATDLAKIRTIMEEEDMEVACAICYVEDRRQLDGPVAQDFIDSLAIYREGGKIRPDGKPFNANQLKAFKLIEGDTYTPSIYELISLKGRNSLKAKNPAMEEAWVKFNNARGMQSVRLLLNDAEYKRQILKYSPTVVKRKNDLGGLRIYSFSDMEMFHLIDIIQVITDSATVGLSLQGYTKVNEYAKAVKDTGEKLNRSLIPKGDLGYHMENGRVVLDFDTVEGIDINHPDFFDNIDNPNIGNIVIGINATQIKAAMTSKFIDQIIPFHTGQSNEVLGEKGIGTWDNYKDFQSERDAKTKKKSAHQINIYTEVINAAEAEGHPITNKVEFVNKFLEVCRENNLIPRFSDFLDVNENGEYIYTEGYHKFLVDFKTFDQNTGEYLPQKPVKPIFDNEYITKLLTDYVESQKVKDAEFTKAMPKVLERITNEIVNSEGNTKYSDRDSLDNNRDKRYNLYTTTDDFIREVVPKDRNDFSRSLANKTSGMNDGEKRTLTICCAKRVYLFVADGYMHGEMIKSVSANDKQLAEEIKYEFKQTDQSAKTADLWNEAVQSRTGRLHGDNSALGGRGGSDIAVGLSDNTSSSDTARDTERERVAYRTEEEYDEIVKKVREMYGLDTKKYSDRDSWRSVKSIQGLEGYSVDEIIDITKNHIQNILEEYGEYAEIVEIRPYGSRAKGTAKTKSDLDIVVQYEGDIREDDMFNMLNDDDGKLYIDGIEVDINPITAGDTGDIEDYLGRVYEYDKYKDTKYSDRDSYAPTFYSHMGKVIDGIKIEKMGAGGVVSYLTGKGVKAEEIKWSGIEAFLEGKKSVTKAELQEFVAGSQLQIEEEMSGVEAFDIIQEGEDYIVKDKDGNILDTWERTQAPDDPDLMGWISMEEGDIVSTVEEIREYTSDWYGDEGTRWSQYRLDGGTNYRELVFKMPNATHSNNAMRAHWGQDAEGVLAHARIQDMTTANGKKMLFIEEIQSDWHNEGHSKGYAEKLSPKQEKRIAEIESQRDKLNAERQAAAREARAIFPTDGVKNTELKEKYDELTAQIRKLDDELWAIYGTERTSQFELPHQEGIPDAPFRNNYHEYVLKRLLRMAAEEGYDSIGWTTADIQSDRWSDQYAEGYRIEYDQDIPKFLRKYGKKWGATVGTTLLGADDLGALEQAELEAQAKMLDAEEAFNQALERGDQAEMERLNLEYLQARVAYNKAVEKVVGGKEGTKVWSMDIPDSMKQSVLTEGQPLYSDRNTASFKGKAFWSGSVSLLDGVIEEVHTMEEAEAVDYHHSMYFSSAQLEKMENGENAFFWVDNGKVQGNWRESVPKNILKRIEEQIEISPSVVEQREFSDADIKYSIREEAPPKETKEGYKVFVVKDGKLYPPMVANPDAQDTPVGVWLNADVGTRAPDSKTGRMQVKAGGKGTQGGSGSLAFRPGWHLGETPLATQFDRLNPETGVKELFPENFVWALCDIAADHDYQEEAMSYGYTKNGKFQHSLAGLPKLPTDGYYKYRTNPNPDTVPWLITGAMKVKKLLSDAEVNAILKEKGLAPKQRVGGDKTLADLGLSKYEGKVYQDRAIDGLSNRSLLTSALETAAQNDIEREKLKQYKQKIDLINSEEQKLHDLREQIKELSFAKGPRDTQAIKSLQFEANQAANRINTYDRQLLQLESTKALKGVLEREKAQARMRAEKQGKEALERYRERATKTQRELMDRYQESRKRGVESRNKTAMRHKIKDVVNELNQYLLKGTKDKHIPIELQKPVAEALDAVNMDTVGAEERIARLKAEMMKAKTPEAIQEIAKKIEHIEEMGGNMEAKLSRLKAAYDSIINSDDPLVANSHDEVISNTIANVMEFVGSTPLRDMSLGQLEAVYDMYRMVLHSIRTANKAFKAKKSEEISVIANRVLEEVDKLGKKRVYRTKTGDAISTFDWNNLKPVYAFERIGSDTFTEVFDNVRAGEDAWAIDMTEAQEFREEQQKKYKYDSWDYKKRYEFTSTSGKSFTLSLDQIMSLYAYSKRGEQAKDHLKNGGFVFDGLTEVKQKNKLGVTKTYQLKDATAYNLSDEILVSIIGKLTPEQKAFVDVMQDYLSTVMGEKGNEVSLELYGVKLFKEKNYFPLKSAPQFLERAREQAQQTGKIKNSGFTKETTPKARNPIVLTPFMDVWAGHVNEMSMYHAFTLPLEDFYRVFNYKTPVSETMAQESVIQFLENAHGAASVSYIDQLLKDLNGGARSDPRETVAKTLMSRFKKSAVMGSLSVVVQQPTSIVRAMALVDAKYFGVAPITRGVIKAFNRKKHKALWAEVKKYAPVAIIKEMGYFDTGMGKSSVEWLKGEKTFIDKVDDALSKAPAVADELAWISIWEAVKRETAHKNPSLKTNSEEFLKLAGERFTEVITKTQVYDSTLAKSSNMRSKSAFMNMWTAFMAEPTTTINMVVDAFRKGNKKYIAKVLGASVGSIALNAALVSLVHAMRDDDEDETYTEKYLSRFTTEFVDGINPITYIPFFKDIWSVAQGFDVERADMSLVTDLIGTLQDTVKVMNKDTSNMDDEELQKHEKDVADALWGIVDSISSLAGIPEKNIRRDIDGIINLFETLGRDMDTSYGSLMDNIAEDVKASTPVWGWLPSESKADKLYDAIINRDTVYVDRIKSGYKDESSYNSALRKALRENDPRIKQAAEAVVNGRGAEYARLVNEIVNEGNFERKIVTGAIAAEVEKMRKAD